MQEACARRLSPRRPAFLLQLCPVACLRPCPCLPALRCLALGRPSQLERIATAGILFVVLLAVIFVYSAAATGFPAIASGELPLFRPALAAHVPEAVAVLSFA